MPEIRSVADAQSLTLTVTAEFTATTAERLWQLWADREQLQRWWGPPGYPATFTRHDFSVPGTSVYFMTGPEGIVGYGWWHFLELSTAVRIRIEDGFGDADGNPDPQMPDSSEMVVDFEPTEAGARFSIRSQFASPELMEQMLEMGQEEGMTLALGQIDAILAEDAPVV